MHWIMIEDAEVNKIDKLMGAILTTDLEILIIKRSILRK